MGKSSIPLYQQIVEDIKRQITSGELKEGDRLMTEKDLEEVYQVSRITVRKAIEMLADEGYVTKQQGIGTFVEKKKLNRSFTNKIMSFTEVCLAEGKIPSSELIALEWVPATPQVSKYLEIEEDERVLKIERVRKIDGNPVLLEELFFPSQFAFLTGENPNGSVYEALKRHGTYVANGVNMLGICYATEEEAGYLQVDTGRALLFQKELAVDSKGDPVHFTRSIVNPDRYNMTIIGTKQGTD